MDERKWMNATDPERMVTFLRDSGKLSERKARLLAVACCRRIWNLLTDEQSQRAVEIAERYADGTISDLELETAQWTAERAMRVWPDDERTARFVQAGVGEEKAREAVQKAAGVAWGVAMPPVQGTKYACEVVRNAGEAVWSISPSWTASVIIREERSLQCHLLRDIFGPLPFRPLALPPSIRTWNDGTVVRLAQAVYQERELPSGHLDLALLRTLADALKEANCTDKEVLGHLREPGAVHVRGCFVLDLLLGKF